MAFIETKFDVGDVVFYATTATTRQQHPCPDCLGERKWSARSPAGTDYEVACPRCAAPYMSNRTLSLTYMWHEPIVKKLTIGLVRANADAWDGPPKHEYMCHETGIGGGSVYREADLFASEEEARAFAKAKADLANTDPKGWAAKRYADTVQFSDYQLNDAAVKAAEGATSQLGYRIQYLLEDLKDAERLEEVKERIERWENEDQS